MAIKVNDIKSVNWQLSLRNPGEVVEGIEDIRQCIGIILTTTKGSDPLRPFFGSSIYLHIDKPVGVAAALISAEILDALTRWETRIKIIRLLHRINGSRIDFTVYCELIESGEATEVLFFIDRVSQIEIPAMGRAFSNGFDFGFS